MPRSYPPEFRRKVLDLVEAGGLGGTRSAILVAPSLQVSGVFAGGGRCWSRTNEACATVLQMASTIVAVSSR